MQPLVYIILPVYNGGEFFKQQLYTIFYQNFRNWHLIIINDGSTDETLEIIKNLANQYCVQKKVTLINQKNMGQYAACGVGLEFVRKLCKGNYNNIYIAYCDADDLRMSNKLEIQVEYMQTHTECDLSYHDCWLIDKRNEIIGESTILYFGSIFSSINMKEFIEVGVGHSVISTEIMFKAKFIEDILPVPNFMSQDRWVSICIIATNGNANRIDRRLGYYRLHENSSLHKIFNKAHFKKRQYEVFHFLKERNPMKKITDLEYIIKYRKVQLHRMRDNILIKFIVIIFGFPRIMFLFIKNYIKIKKFRLQLYKSYKKRLQLHSKISPIFSFKNPTK